MDNLELMQQLISVGENHQKTIDQLKNTIDQLKRVVVDQQKMITEQQNILDVLCSYIFTERLNKEKISYEMSVKLRNGFSAVCKDNNRTPKLIVSLTSYPERMYDIKYTLYSLMKQTIKPDMLILWLSEEEFPNKEKDISDEIRKLRDFGLSIKWCKNTRSYKKLIPAMREYPDACIVTADDDVWYQENWLEILYNTYLTMPEYVNCHRAHRIQVCGKELLPYNSWEHEISSCAPSVMNFGTGVGGIMYPPLSSGMYYKDLMNEDLFMELCPTTDDIWFWAMEVLQGTKINVVANNQAITSVNYDRENGLSSERTLFATNKQGGNDEGLERILKHYPQIQELVCGFDQAGN